MHNILAIKSIPLKKGTIEAWKTGAAACDVELRFAKRGWDERKLVLEASKVDVILNLGNVEVSEHVFDVPDLVFNHSDLVKYVSTPSALRRSVLGGNHIPPPPVHNGVEYEEDFWSKRPGFGGLGKVFEIEGTPYPGFWATGTDLQKHIEGEEYRVNTVGLNIVQVTKKSDQRDHWTWVGVEACPKNVKRIVRHALAALVNENPHHEFSVLGFDVIDDGSRAWIIETNTCPGVNPDTARRIITGIKVVFSDPLPKTQLIEDRLAWTRMFG